MSSSAQRWRQEAKQPVSAALTGPYGHPFHPILVTVPIGAWAGSLVLDIAPHAVGDPGFLARRSMWLIAVGAVGDLATGATPAATPAPAGGVPAERRFPVAVVLGHGLLAVVTVVLVLLSALSIGGS
ncbi:hypothetical protein OU787_31125 [Kitasatospora sp. YST-16]|uniref:DUF2231 domain-containing protein n=1 Tax=unclassified Kitasatospora TaxID=2633591 RepID=UPI00068F5C99|nr:MULTISPECIES: DUF2231 domain-containing protein [unclassified Kitasatospora]WAL75593.1 hypothetical protein OU787_31125 [Kitasatospora sp. YST-16]WNW41659.1 DUF2231 domain-containing protein [Streptomyces sp. Li-HN-5-13]